MADNTRIYCSFAAARFSCQCTGVGPDRGTKKGSAQHNPAWRFAWKDGQEIPKMAVLGRAKPISRAASKRSARPIPQGPMDRDTRD